MIDDDRFSTALADFAIAQPVLSALLSDDRRIVISGARGWIGRTMVELLQRALGAEGLSQRVALFGSAAAPIALDTGHTVVQRPLADLPLLDRRPTMLFHLAFMTMDKVAGMAPDAYAAANRALSRQVLDALDPIGVDRLFVASAGAAAFADDATAAAALRLYGGLKREDEDMFAAWAQAAPSERRAAIARIYSVSGPWMNKHQTYALADFILTALANRPIEVRAPTPVLRSYVAVRELVSVVLAVLLSAREAPVLRFDTGGEALELGQVADAVARSLGGKVLNRRITQAGESRYVGDDHAWQALLRRHGIDHLGMSQQIVETAAWLMRGAAAVR